MLVRVCLLFFALLGLAAAQCPPNTYANANWTLTPANVIATGTCVAGWQGAPTRKCNEGGWATSVNNHCTRVFCPAVTEGNADWLQTQGASPRVGTCLSGFGGRVVRTCGANGAWGPIEGSCAKCPAEYYGRVNWKDTPARAFDYGVCDLGYVGSPYRWCMDGGIWQSYIWNVCQRGVCNATDLDNASWPQTQTFDYATGTCLPGFVGTIRRQCQGDGTFGPIVSGSCTSASIQCPAVTYGTASYPATNSGSPATGVCQAGWEGSPTRQCGSGGVWASNVANPCTQRVCSTHVINSITFPSAKSGQNAKGTCPEGTTPIDGPYRFCDNNGNWAATVRGRCA